MPSGTPRAEGGHIQKSQPVSAYQNVIIKFKEFNIYKEFPMNVLENIQGRGC